MRDAPPVDPPVFVPVDVDDLMQGFVLVFVCPALHFGTVLHGFAFVLF